MDNCEYICNNSNSQEDINLKTYNSSHLELNNFKIIKIIKHLFMEKFFYDKKELILLINSFDTFSYNIINNTLNEIVTNNNYIFEDKYNSPGKIINIGTLYIFQPSHLNNDNSSLYSKTTPIYFNDAYISIKNSNDIICAKYKIKTYPSIYYKCNKNIHKFKKKVNLNNISNLILFNS